MYLACLKTTVQIKMPGVMPNKVRCLVCSRVLHPRFYSSRVTIGAKFTSIDQITEFIDKNSWSIEKYLNIDSIQAGADNELPSRETVYKLLRLSGLPADSSVDIKPIQRRLGKQLKFIKKLQSIPLENENVDTRYARILPRHTKQLTYDELLNTIRYQKEHKHEDEISGSWKPSSRAVLSQNGYFVVNKDL